MKKVVSGQWSVVGGPVSGRCPGRERPVYSALRRIDRSFTTGLKGIVFLLVLVPFLAGCQARTAAPEAAKEDEAKPPIAVEVVKAARKDVEETIAAQGTLAAAQGASVKLAPQTAGRLVEVAVREGDKVSAGQVLATLDARAAAAQSRSADAAYRAATSTAEQARISATAAASDQESGVRLARLTVEAAVADRDAAVQSAQTSLRLARTDAARTEAGARPQEIAQAEAAVRQAEATRVRAASEAERQQFLFEKGVSAKRQSEDAQTALTVAETGVASANQALLLIKAGARTEDRAAAQLRVRQAEELLAQAIKTGEAKIAQANAGLRQAQQQALAVAAKAQEARAAADNAGKAAADAAAARATADYTVLRSPISGIVTKRPLGPGDIADPTGTVLEITDTRKLDLLVSLPAGDAAKIRAGQKAHLSFSEGNMAEGVVVSVGGVDPQSNLASARIRVENGTGRLTVGTFAQARIVTADHPGAITVPKEALLTREGKSVVYVVQGDTAKETPVEVGAETDDGATEITKGVPAGATVVRLGNYELTDGAKITTAKEGEKEGDAKKEDGKGAANEGNRTPLGRGLKPTSKWRSARCPSDAPSPPTPLPQTGEGGRMRLLVSLRQTDHDYRPPSPVCGRGVGGEGASEGHLALRHLDVGFNPCPLPAGRNSENAGAAV